MIKNVLLVDDDQEMLLALKEGFTKYQDSFSVLLASDGQVAVAAGLRVKWRLKKRGFAPGVAVIVLGARADMRGKRFSINEDLLVTFAPPGVCTVEER